jgi:hypothetical protein
VYFRRLLELLQRELDKFHRAERPNTISCSTWSGTCATTPTSSITRARMSPSRASPSQIGAQAN